MSLTEWGRLVFLQDFVLLRSRSTGSRAVSRPIQLSHKLTVYNSKTKAVTKTILLDRSKEIAIVF